MDSGARGNPLAFIPTWTGKAEHMDKVAQCFSEQGNQRVAEAARTQAATFRHMAEVDGEVSWSSRTSRSN